MTQRNLKFKNTEQLIAEADELMKQFDSNALKSLEEEHRLLVQTHVQNLEKIKLGMQYDSETKDTSQLGSGAEGMHEAILDIVKAFKEMKKFLLR